MILIIVQALLHKHDFENPFFFLVSQFHTVTGNPHHCINDASGSRQSGYSVSCPLSRCRNWLCAMRRGLPSLRIVWQSSQPQFGFLIFVYKKAGLYWPLCNSIAQTDRDKLCSGLPQRNDISLGFHPITHP